MNQLISQPQTGAIVDKDGNPIQGFQTFIGNVFTLLNLMTQSGTTAQRPDSTIVGRWIGLPYFDTSLGLPVFLKSVGPDVWVTAAGIPA